MLLFIKAAVLRDKTYWRHIKRTKNQIETQSCCFFLRNQTKCALIVLKYAILELIEISNAKIIVE